MLWPEFLVALCLMSELVGMLVESSKASRMHQTDAEVVLRNQILRHDPYVH